VYGLKLEIFRLQVPILLIALTGLVVVQSHVTCSIPLTTKLGTEH